MTKSRRESANSMVVFLSKSTAHRRLTLDMLIITKIFYSLNKIFYIYSNFSY